MNRNTNADLLKSIAIFGVVFIHGASIFGDFDILLFFKNAFRFAVPCFIILWAYFFENSYRSKSKEERLGYRYKRFIHLFRVFVLWSLLYFFITINWGTLNFKNLVTKFFSGYGWGWSGQYFFLVLFQLILFYPLLRKLYEIRFLRILTMILIGILYVIFGYFLDSVPNLIVKVGYRPFYFWLPYVFLGIALTKTKIRKVSPWFAITPIFIALEFLILKRMEISHLEYITMSVLVLSMIFCISMLKKKTKVIPQAFDKTIGFIGKNTLIVFVSNPMIILMLGKIYKIDIVNDTMNLLPIWIKVIISFLLVVLIFLVTLGIAKFLHKTKLIKVLG